MVGTQLLLKQRYVKLKGFEVVGLTPEDELPSHKVLLMDTLLHVVLK